MDSWLKGLIAAACIVVIACGGLYLWDDYQQKQAAEALRATQAAYQSRRTECLLAANTVKALTSSRTSPAFAPAERTADKCAEQGYLPKRYWEE